MEQTHYNRELLHHFYQFISDNKRNKFEQFILDRTRYICVALEDIFQPHNASAVIRTCDCFGIQDIHFIENDNKYRVNPDITLGSNKWVSLICHNSLQDNTPETIRHLRSSGYRIVATSPHIRNYSPKDLPLDQKIALFFGKELEGLSDTVINEADMFVHIPMYGFTESFNISVSAAILIHALTERLRELNIRWKLSEEEMVEIKLDWARNTIRMAPVIEKEFYENYRE